MREADVKTKNKLPLSYAGQTSCINAALKHRGNVLNNAAHAWRKAQFFMHSTLPVDTEVLQHGDLNEMKLHTTL